MGNAIPPVIQAPTSQTIYCDKVQQERFRQGDRPLAAAWADAYPMLFDSEDRRIAKTQPENHFWEWATAIHFYHAYGYHSLVEQYQFPIQKRKQGVLKRLSIPPDITSLLRPQGRQGPDLVVFNLHSNPPDWFFCEVKGDRDRLRPAQQKFFNELRAASTCPTICLVKGVLTDSKKAASQAG